MKYYVIADQKNVDGFALAGVQGTAIQDMQTAHKAVCCALQDTTIGTLLVSRQVYGFCQELLEQHKKRGVFPVVVILDPKEMRKLQG